MNLRSPAGRLENALRLGPADGVDGLVGLGSHVIPVEHDLRPVAVGFARMLAGALMNAGLMSAQTRRTRVFGSPPCACRSAAKAATVAASRPSVANSTRCATRSMNSDT